jgi:hypothetical protein
MEMHCHTSEDGERRRRRFLKRGDSSGAPPIFESLPSSAGVNAKYELEDLRSRRLAASTRTIATSAL